MFDDLFQTIGLVQEVNAVVFPLACRTILAVDSLGLCDGQDVGVPPPISRRGTGKSSRHGFEAGLPDNGQLARQRSRLQSKEDR